MPEIRLRWRCLVLSICLFCSFFCRSIVFAQTEQQSTGGDPGRQPRLVVPKSVYDFGVVTQGEKVEHAFAIRNEGSAPLKIEHLHSSCGCAAAVVASDTIEAGGETAIQVTFDTTGFQGPKLKTIRFYSNDSRQPSMLLTLQGTVQTDVRLSESRLNFGKLSKGQAAEKTLIVASKPKSGVQILEATAGTGSLEVLSEGYSSHEEIGRKFNVVLKSALPVGIFRDRIMIRTTSRNNPVINVAVFAEVEGDLSVEPAAVSFGLLEGPLAKPISKTVRIINRGKVPVRILNVESDNADVQAEIVAKSNQSAGKQETGTQLMLTVRPDVVGAFRARVKIKTNHADPEQQELFVPVYGVVTRGAI